MSALRGVASEITSVLGHLVRYPTGMGQDWRARTTSEDGAPSTPVLLIHGFGDNKSIFGVLRRALVAAGCPAVASFGYSPLDQDVRAIAGRLGARVEELCAETGSAKVHLVGHSLGGLVARYYVQRMGGSTRVDTVVTMGSPHSGTLAAWLVAPLPLAQQVRPGSRLFAELAEPAPDCTTRFLVFSSEMDELILPARRARLEHPDLEVRNVVLQQVGHLALPSHPQVVAEVCAALGPADTDAAGSVAG